MCFFFFFLVIWVWILGFLFMWVSFFFFFLKFLQFEENLEQWPHLKELVQCYTADWVKDENKYGHFESVGHASFQNQIYEGPDTDIETGKTPFWVFTEYNWESSTLALFLKWEYSDFDCATWYVWKFQAFWVRSIVQLRPYVCSKIES